MIDTEKDRLRYLNDKYDLNLRLGNDEGVSFDDFRQKPLFEEMNVCVNMLEITKDKEKRSKNLRKLNLTEKVEFVKNNNWHDNSVIFQSFLNNRDLWFFVSKMRHYKIVFVYETTNFITVDIDCEEDLTDPFVRRLLLKYPYYLSMERRLPKIILPRNYKMPPALYHCGFKPSILKKTDVLGDRNMSYVPIDGRVYNADFSVEDIRESDYAGCPLIQTTEPSNTENKRKRDTSFPPITEQKLVEMLEFIAKCSAKEYPLHPEKRVGASYNGDGHSWLKFASAIKGWNDDKKGFAVLHNFSKLCPNYDPVKWSPHGESFQHFQKCEPRSVGFIVNLYHDFRSSFPPSSFMENTNITNPRQTQILSSIMDSGEVNHLNLASLFLTFPSFKNRYKYCNMTDTWYEILEDNRWVKRKNIYITKFIQTEFIPFLQNVIENTKDTDAIKVLCKVKDKVGFVDFQNGIFKNATPHLQENEFFTTLDKNVNLLSFENGVFDITTRQFRPRQYDDYISLSTNHQYYDYDDIPNDAKKFFENFITTICMTKEQEKDETKKNEIYTFFCKIMCLFLFGANLSNSVVIFTGEGGNGKSRLFKLHTLGLGQYIRKLEPTYFTSVKTASHGTSPLASCQGLRLIYTSEPDHTQKLQGPLIKDISGNEPMNVRALYKNDFQLFVQFILYFQTNNMPLITNSGDENSLLRRLIIFDFPNIFKNKEDCEEENPSNREKQDKLDLEIEKYSCFWASYLVHMFIKYHGQVYPEKNLTPFLESSKCLVKEYLGESNTVLTFMEQFYIPMDLTEQNKKNYKVSAEKLLGHYNDIHKSAQIQSVKKFGKLLCKIPEYKKCQFKISNMYYCLKERMFNDDDDDDEEKKPSPDTLESVLMNLGK